MADVKHLNGERRGNAHRTEKRKRTGATGAKCPNRKAQDEVAHAEKRAKRDARARENALKRPDSDRKLSKRPDRIRQYLIHFMDDFLFDEFTEAYLKSGKLENMMRGVPIPLRKEDAEAFRGGKGLPVTLIGENMARVIGIDPKFRHAEAYEAFLLRFLGRRVADTLVRNAKQYADSGDYEAACIHFRAALVLKPEDPAAMYGYARICRAMYNKSADAVYTGNFKAESLDYLEMLTELHPKFGQGWYYLGYMYLNLGLYTKACLAWESFLPLSRIAKDRREIELRMEQIRTPMEIERGCNAALAGRWEESAHILEPFADSVYKDWWPLWHYLGEAYLHTDRRDKAKEAFHRVLALNATHTGTMETLIVLYEEEENPGMVKKYRDKIALLRENG